MVTPKSKRSLYNEKSESNTSNRSARKSFSRTDSKINHEQVEIYAPMETLDDLDDI